jgi:Delta24-sterol reductase
MVANSTRLSRLVLFLKAMGSHNEAVSTIAASVRTFYDRKSPYRIYHGSTNSTRQSALTRNGMIDVSKLNRVLHVDTAAKTALVEPNVAMDELIDATLPYGLIPPVVMEFPGITVGGGFSGTSGESSSFRYGFFDRIVNSIEIVLANGEVVIASRTERSDLFYGAAACFGTMGVVTLLELQLIEAKPYVELTYHPVHSATEAVAKIEDITKDSTIDYLDGILYAKNRGVICAGRLTDTPNIESRVRRFTRAKDPWFYLHVQKMIKTYDYPSVETLPLVDYLFRYDRGGFWVGRYAYTYFITPFNIITRYILDYFMHTRVMYHALHQSGLHNMYVIQDVAVPYTTASEFVDFLHEDFAQYPLWLCPLKQTGQSTDSPHGLMAEKPAPHAPEMLLNFGVWGPGPRDRQKFVDLNRRLERKVDSLGGKKWLYAQAYYTEKEFWNIYNKDEYDALRNKYHATHLPSVYDKVKVDVEAERIAVNASWVAWLLALFWSIWPLRGLYGVYKAAMGGDYLLPSSSNRRKSVKEE